LALKELNHDGVIIQDDEKSLSLFEWNRDSSNLKHPDLNAIERL